MISLITTCAKTFLEKRRKRKKKTAKKLNLGRILDICIYELIHDNN